MSEWSKVIITCESGKVVEFDPEDWNETQVLKRLEKEGEKIVGIKHIDEYKQYRNKD